MSVSPISLPPAWSPLVENVPSPANEQSVLVAVTFEIENRKKLYNNHIEKLTPPGLPFGFCV